MEYFLISFSFPADIFDEVQQKVAALGVEMKCLGGGRIDHDAKNKKIKVYGYSQVGQSFFFVMHVIHTIRSKISKPIDL